MQQVMPMGCDRWISIRFVSLARQKTDGERKGACTILNEFLGFTFYMENIIGTIYCI